MTSTKQKEAAKKNIKKAQKKWKSMGKRRRAIAQPQGRVRKKPGTGGKGKYYRVVVRPKSEFVTFRAHDVGKKGHIIRLAGRRKSGSWSTQAWLIAKTDAKKVGRKLIGKTSDVKKLLAQLQSTPKTIKGDVMKARPRKNVPESKKPTLAMRRAQRKNIWKAIKARWKK